MENIPRMRLNDSSVANEVEVPPPPPPPGANGGSKIENTLIVHWIHTKIALNVVKAWNLLQMKLLSCRSKIELRAFRNFSPFVCMPICLLQAEVFH